MSAAGCDGVGGVRGGGGGGAMSNDRWHGRWHVLVGSPSERLMLLPACLEAGDRLRGSSGEASSTRAERASARGRHGGPVCAAVGARARADALAVALRFVGPRALDWAERDSSISERRADCAGQAQYAYRCRRSAAAVAWVRAVKDQTVARAFKRTPERRQGHGQSWSKAESCVAVLASRCGFRQTRSL